MRGSLAPLLLLALVVLQAPLMAGQGANEAPTVSIVEPVDGASVEGTVTVSGTAADSDGDVSLVEVRVDGAAWSSATGTEDWTYAWDASAAENGTHTIEARAYDGSLYSTPDIVEVEVGNVTPPEPGPAENAPPVIVILAPPLTSIVVGTVMVSGAASDEDGVVETVEVRIDEGAWAPANGTSNWTYAWNTTLTPDGNHTLSARAFDGTDHSTLATRTVSVRNRDVVTDATPSVDALIVTIDAPADGETVNGTITVSGTAFAGDLNVTKVEVRVDDGPWLRATGTLAWTYRLDTVGLADGEHTLGARGTAGDVVSDVFTVALTVENAADAASDAGNRPPLVVIEEPAAGTLVNATVALRGTARDPDVGDAVVRVEVNLPGIGWKEATGDNAWNLTWHARGTAPGDYVLQVRAVDRHNATGRASLPITIEAANSRPTLDLDIPLADDEVSALLVVEGRASDPNADALRLDVKIGGLAWSSFPIVSDETFRVVVHTGAVPPGPQTLVVRVFDGHAASQETRVPLMRVEAQSGLDVGPSWLLVAGGIVLLLALVGLALALVARRATRPST